MSLRSKTILVETQNFENITSLASQDWWMISSSCQFTEFKIKLTLGKLFFTKINDFRCCFSILMMAFFSSTYLLHSFRIIFMALIYFAYKVLTFQFCEIFCMNGNKSSLFSSPQILGNYFARRKILAETFELSVSAKFPLSWILPKVRACKNKDKQISQDLRNVLPDGPIFEFISTVFR